MSRRWEKKALKHGWTPPDASGGRSVTPVLILGGLATGFGLAWLFWENLGRQWAQDGAVASLPSPVSARLSIGERVLPGEPSPDDLEAFAAGVSPATLTDGEEADMSAAPANTIDDPVPKSRGRRKSATSEADSTQS